MKLFERKAAKPDNDVKIEIIAHKKATRAQVNRVKKANDTLNELFGDNNFTVKLFLAARKH